MHALPMSSVPKFSEPVFLAPKMVPSLSTLRYIRSSLSTCKKREIEAQHGRATEEAMRMQLSRGGPPT